MCQLMVEREPPASPEGSTFPMAYDDNYVCISQISHN